MKYFSYRKLAKQDQLFVENLAIEEIAKQIATPFYCYSKQSIIANYQDFASNFSDIDHKICYAIKANCNLNIIKIFASLASGIDAVSAGEINRALIAGIDPKKIVFAGVGKSKEEITYALNNGIEEIAAESESEIFLINQIASSLNKKVKLSIRVNPDVDAKTHDKISTGRKGDKFGIDIKNAKNLYQKAKNLPAIDVYGISTHIGSQITSLEPFKNAFLKIRQLCIDLRKDGFDIRSLDFGGGIGILYKDENVISIASYAKMIKEIIKDLNVKLTLAPGRALIGNSGILVSKILYLKETDNKNFIILDAGMNDLMRPGLYDAHHEILPAIIKTGQASSNYDLVGPVCESTDILAKNRQLIAPQPSDLIIFCSAGAYGSSMSSEYNCRPLIPEILVDDNDFKIIRRRPNFEEMIYLEK
jgi:diaminopimelate decarboxylase